MKAGRTLVCLLALAPLLFGFEPLRSRNGDVEQGNALLKAGNAEEAEARQVQGDRRRRKQRRLWARGRVCVRVRARLAEMRMR